MELRFIRRKLDYYDHAAAQWVNRSKNILQHKVEGHWEDVPVVTEEEAAYV